MGGLGVVVALGQDGYRLYQRLRQRLRYTGRRAAHCPGWGGVIS